jgi:hypothetical protein
MSLFGPQLMKNSVKKSVTHLIINIILNANFRNFECSGIGLFTTCSAKTLVSVTPAGADRMPRPAL